MNATEKEAERAGMLRRKFLKYALVSAASIMVAVSSAYFYLSRKARVPPGQSEVSTLQVIVGPDSTMEPIDPEAWELDVCGEVERPLKLSWRQLLDLPKTTQNSDFHCVGVGLDNGWTKLDNRWEGVKFREIAHLVKPTAEAKYVTLGSFEEYQDPNGRVYSRYTTQHLLEDLLRDDVLLAYRLDGKELSHEHGGPVRLILPEKYGYKGVKWIKRFKFTNTRELGFYESRGYSYTADPWTNDRYAQVGT
jgi:DMSO/TMAO reductase YedYZ molybdopterin-dependent catalytic subunit